MILSTIQFGAVAVVNTIGIGISANLRKHGSELTFCAIKMHFVDKNFTKLFCHIVGSDHEDLLEKGICEEHV